MNEAIKENRWLILAEALLLAIALYITLTPGVQAQRGGCRQVTSYACVIRNGQWVCGNLTYTICVPVVQKPRERWGFW